MKIKRLEDVPESHKVVWLCRAPFFVVLWLIYFYPEYGSLRTLLWVMCLIDLAGSACDAGAVVLPENNHDTHIAREGRRAGGSFDFLLAAVVAFFGSRVLSPQESFEVTMLLGFGWYVRFSSWWFWDKAQARKEEADIGDGPGSAAPAHVDCRCPGGMSGEEFRQALSGGSCGCAGLAESAFPMDFARTVARMHPQNNTAKVTPEVLCSGHVQQIRNDEAHGRKIDVQV